MTQNLWKEQDKEEKRIAYSGPRTALNRGINVLVALYDDFFLSQLLVSKPHKKSTSAVDYMNTV